MLLWMNVSNDDDDDDDDDGGREESYYLIRRDGCGMQFSFKIICIREKVLLYSFIKNVSWSLIQRPDSSDRCSNYATGLLILYWHIF